MPIIIIGIGLFILLPLWLVSRWVDDHALAVLTKTGYILEATQWAGLGIPVGFGFLTGTLLGLGLGGLFFTRLGTWVSLYGYKKESEDRKELIRMKGLFAQERDELTAAIHRAGVEGRTHAEERANQAEKARIIAEEQVRQLSKRVQNLEGRLAGSQQRSRRKAKQALLKSCVTAKPTPEKAIGLVR
jgi:hypothetical protein